VVLLNKIPYL
jgi:hypothetical protein